MVSPPVSPSRSSCRFFDFTFFQPMTPPVDPARTRNSTHVVSMTGSFFSQRWSTLHRKRFRNGRFFPLPFIPFVIGAPSTRLGSIRLVVPFFSLITPLRPPFLRLRKSLAPILFFLVPSHVVLAKFLPKKDMGSAGDCLWFLWSDRHSLSPFVVSLLFFPLYLFGSPP